MSTLCCQCGKKPAIVSLGGNPLCIDCYAKLQEINTQNIMSLMTEMNYLSDYMELTTGLSGVLPRYKIPTPISNRAPLTFNNINVDRSVVGAINTANVKQIDITLSNIKNSGNEEGAKAVKEFTEAVLSDRNLKDEIKNEIIELISFLTKQSTLKKENRPTAVIKSVLSQVEKLISITSTLVHLWPKVISLLGL